MQTIHGCASFCRDRMIIAICQIPTCGTKTATGMTGMIVPSEEKRVRKKKVSGTEKRLSCINVPEIGA
jgi:hypothetical protein